jgi:hypothetical protein
MYSYKNKNWDLSVDNRNGQLTLVVEVKSKRNASPEWAAQFRRNILTREFFPQAPYFLMVFPDRFYLWTNADTQPEQSEPDYIIDASSILQPYFERAGVKDEQISSQSLELIIMVWLLKTIHATKPFEDFSTSEQWLIESGLYEAIAGGKLEDATAA